MTSGLTRIVAWAQTLAAEVLHPGDFVVDLTAGTGRDTLFLARQVGPAGCVFAFDIQPQALMRSAELLTASGIPPRHPAISAPVELSPGVHLLLAGHENLSRYLPAAPAAIIANLGFLPGGDQTITTTPATTRAALSQALTVLKPGGRLVVVLYLVHPGAAAEAAVVEELFSALAPEVWQVLRLGVANLPHAPFLLAAQRRKS